MESKKTFFNKANFKSKEAIALAAGGLVVGIVLTFIILLCTNFFAKATGIAKLKHGSEAVATVYGETISSDTIYQKAKMANGLNYVIGEADKIIFKDMYQLTDKEQKDAESEAEYYISYYEEMGYTKEDFLEGNGFKDYDEFLEDIKSNIKIDKYIYECLEKELEDGAVQKYYDEHKDELDTYNSEHILVRITDDVKDEEALKLANEIIEKLNGGAEFSQVVEEYKEKTIHEELGYQGKSSALEQAYIDEIVALADGEYSKTPVKTSYGYHIVHKISTSTMEDAKGTILETLAADILQKDSYYRYKALVDLRKEKNLVILDEYINNKYEEYVKELNEQ